MPADQPDPERFRSDDDTGKGQDLGRAVTQMAEEDIAAVGPGAPTDASSKDGEPRSDG